MVTKSDWFMIISFDCTLYKLEIFGVNRQKDTKHCMKLLSIVDEELEIFHLDELNWVIKKYDLHMFVEKKYYEASSTLHADRLSKENLIKHSKQLQSEGKGVIKPGTDRLMRMMRRRRQ